MATFSELFGGSPTVTADAPGRVNLIGEHTDYNGGFVLPAVIPQRTVVELGPRADRHMRVWSANVDEDQRLVDFDLGEETATGTWGDYIQGVCVALAQRGFRLQGANLRIESSVPLGTGLSSSAACICAASTCASSRRCPSAAACRRAPRSR